MMIPGMKPAANDLPENLPLLWSVLADEVAAVAVGKMTGEEADAGVVGALDVELGVPVGWDDAEGCELVGADIDSSIAAHASFLHS